MASEPAAPRRWRPRTPGRRVALAVGAGLATFAILVVLDGVWAGTSLLRNLTRARSELGVAIGSIVTGDPEAAAPHFVAAAGAADDALGAVGHPSMAIAGLLPVVGDNIDAAAAVAESSGATARAGTTMVRVSRDLAWTDIGLPASTAAGRLDIPAFEAAAPSMDAVVSRLREALQRLEAAGEGRLIGPVAVGYRDALEGLELRADLASRLRDVIHLMPAMFGGEEPRRYLVCVPSLGVPRPGGGAPTAVGVLTAADGSLTIEPLAPAPEAIARVPGSPDWPTTARALSVAAKEVGFPRLDGVIRLDAVALQDLVWAIGDVEVPGRKLPFSDRTTTDALEIDAFLGSSPRKASSLQAAWVSRILLEFLARRPGVESFALATAADARDRHLAVYLVRPDEQRLVKALGLDGRARFGGRGFLPVVASWASTSSSHVGALVDVAIRYDVAVRPDGSASVRTEVLFENRAAGTGPPSVLLGRPAAGVGVGTFAADVTLYLPADARNVVAETSRPSPIEVGARLGLSTVTGSVTVRGAESTTLTATYAVDDAVRTVEGVHELVLRLVPQPTIAGIRYQVRISLPEGSTIASGSPAIERHGRTAAFSGVRAGPVDLELRYV